MLTFHQSKAPTGNQSELWSGEIEYIKNILLL